MTTIAHARASRTPSGRARSPEDTVFSKIAWRILPLLLLAYMVATSTASTSATRSCR
jgi:hypothetical protein